MPAPYLNGGQQPVPVRTTETWVVAPVWERIERKLDRVTYILGGFIVAWVVVTFGPPLVAVALLSLTGPAT